jgi:hypothetical protein
MNEAHSMLPVMAILAQGSLAAVAGWTLRETPAFALILFVLSMVAGFYGWSNI